MGARKHPFFWRWPKLGDLARSQCRSGLDTSSVAHKQDRGSVPQNYSAKWNRFCFLVFSSPCKHQKHFDRVCQPSWLRGCRSSSDSNEWRRKSPTCYWTSQKRHESRWLFERKRPGDTFWCLKLFCELNFCEISKFFFQKYKGWNIVTLL